jgi:hypothetical protein
MNCLFSTCRLSLIPGGWSATRKLLQKSRYVPINALECAEEQYHYAESSTIREPKFE